MVQNVGELKSGFQKILKQFYHFYIGVMEKKKMQYEVLHITYLCIWMQKVIMLNAFN